MKDRKFEQLENVKENQMKNLTMQSKMSEKIIHRIV